MTNLCCLQGGLVCCRAVKKRLQSGKGDNCKGEGNLNHAKRVYGAGKLAKSSALKTFLTGSGRRTGLTNKVFLSCTNLETRKANDGAKDGQSTEDEGEREALGWLKNTLDQQNRRKGIY